MFSELSLFSQVGISLIEATDKHWIISSDIDNYRNGSMTGFGDYFRARSVVTIEIDLAECQAF
jgi:hypothetical protein